MDKDQPSKRVCLGRIADAHGVRGLVKILPFCEDHTLLETLSPLFAGDKMLSIKLKNPIGKYYIAEVSGVTERDGALALKGTELFAERDRLPEIEEDGRYYHEDLIGMKTVNENGTYIGTVIAVKNFGAGDLIEIKPPVGVSFYVPFTAPFVLSVDKDTRIIVANPPEMS